MNSLLKTMTLGVLLATSGAFTTVNAAQIDMNALGGYSIPVSPTVEKATIQEPMQQGPRIQITPLEQPSTTSQVPAQTTQPASTNEISPANYDGHLDNFPSRKVTLVVPTALRNENTAAFGKYLSDAVSNVVKYPYYDTTVVSTNTPLSQVTAVDLSQIAQAQGSEIVIMPVPLQDVYMQIPSHYVDQFYRDDSSDIHIQAKVSALIYYYDINEGIVHTIRSGFNQTDDSITMPTHKSVWNKVVKSLLDKLPYKRVPTDRDRHKSPGINAEMPIVTDFQVEQPRNTAYSLKGVSVL